MGTGRLAGLALAAAAMAQGGAAQDAAPPVVTLELNRVEQVEGGCRVDLVVEGGPETLDVLTLDLVLFNPVGLILSRLAVEAGPAPAGRSRVRAFLAEGLGCADIASALVNGVLACEAGGAAVADCEARLATRARGPVTLVR